MLLIATTQSGVQRLLARIGTHIVVRLDVLTDGFASELCMQYSRLNCAIMFIGSTGYPNQRVSLHVLTILWL